MKYVRFKNILDKKYCHISAKLFTFCLFDIFAIFLSYFQKYSYFLKYEYENILLANDSAINTGWALS